jgi:hypothetical protein
VPGADGVTACEPIGAVPPYGNCTNLGQCGKGYQCVGNVCQPFCNSLADCPGPGRDCFQVTSGGTPSTPIPADFICAAGCDPRNPALICGPGTTCEFYDDGITTGCFEQTDTSTTTCDATNDIFACAKGYVCLVDDTCKKWCRIGVASDCTGLTCMATGDSFNGVSYGVCE